MPCGVFKLQNLRSSAGVNEELVLSKVAIRFMQFNRIVEEPVDIGTGPVGSILDFASMWIECQIRCLWFDFIA
jgi:hypothetical protein